MERRPRWLFSPAVAGTMAVLFLVLICGSHLSLFVSAQLHFASLGSWGFQSETQQSVANTLKAVGMSERISLILSPGSNFAGGVSALNDTVWKQNFENVYSDSTGSLKVPFFAVLGSEDWSGNYTAQILRTKDSYNDLDDSHKFPKWTIPNWWYHNLIHFAASSGPSLIKTSHEVLAVAFVFIDTWILSQEFPFPNVTALAWKELKDTLKNTEVLVDWTIVVGDKPIYSSGASKGDSELEDNLLPLFKKHKVDAYISGYDFNLEAIQDEDLSHINCGSGSMGSGTSVLKNSKSQFYMGDSGFCLHTLDLHEFTTQFIDGSTGRVLYTHTQPIKPKPEKITGDRLNYYARLPQVIYYPVPALSPMPSRDAFVKIIGTIGLCIFTFLLILTGATGAAVATKRR